MKSIKRGGRVKVTGSGKGVVSHAGVVLLREVAEDAGLVDSVTGVLADTYRGRWLHVPGRVFCDLAVALADGVKRVSGIEVLRDRERLFGPVASTPTAWRLLGRVDAEHLAGIEQARAVARERVWEAGAGPEPGCELAIDVDATIVLAHTDKENAASTWKRSFGFHPLLSFVDRPEISGGEGLAAVMRPGNAGSSTAADHVLLLRKSLVALPENVRPTPGRPGGPQVLVRTDSAGASKDFAFACREAGCRFSLGFTVDDRVHDAVEALAPQAWVSAIEPDGSTRDDTWVAEITHLVSLTRWPGTSRLIARREPLHPGAQTTLYNTTDDGRYRITCFLTDTPRHGRYRLPGGLATLDLRHRRHARVEDRIRQAKDTGLRNFPCHDFAANTAWLQIVLTALDLVTWTKLLGFAGHHDELARCEIDTFRYRVLHVAAQLVRTARRLELRLDRHWRWTPAITTALTRSRTAFGNP